MAFFNFTIADDATPTRVDAFLVAQLPQYSRSFLAKNCRLTVNDVDTKPSQKVRPGDRVQLAVPAMRDLTIEPEDLPLTILFEDDEIIAIDKAAGMVIHPTDHGGHVTGTLVNALLHHLGKSALTTLMQPSETSVAAEIRPGIVHRLDRDTSGVMVIAKTDAAKASLTAQFADRTVEKEYLALVGGGRLPSTRGRIDAPIGRGLTDRTRREVTMSPDAREAVTEFETEEEFDGATLVRAHILTGRTHQIRVHFTSIGHPVVGDTMYGFSAVNAAIACPRQFLHAAKLTITHPTSGERLTFEAALPADLQAVLADLREE